jgi:hypothetical protein
VSAQTFDMPAQASSLSALWIADFPFKFADFFFNWVAQLKTLLFADAVRLVSYHAQHFLKEVPNSI